MISLEQVSRAFGRIAALSDVNLAVSRGEAVGIVGARGCGRTTLLRIVATLVRPTAGRVRIDGIDVVRNPFAARDKVMYVGDPIERVTNLRLDEYLRLVLSARRRGRPDREALDLALTRTGLDPAVRLEKLPLADRRLVALAAALMVQPDVLLLDQPLGDVDREARSAWQEWIGDAARRGSTLILTADTEADVQPLCSRALPLNGGRLLGSARRPSNAMTGAAGAGGEA